MRVRHGKLIGLGFSRIFTPMRFSASDKFETNVSLNNMTTIFRFYLLGQSNSLRCFSQMNTRFPLFNLRQINNLNGQ